MPTPRSNLGTALALNGWIYAIGGRDPARGYFLNDVYAYEPSSDVWVEVSLLPTPRYNLAVTLGGDSRIYAMGGFAAGFQYTNAAEAYDPDNDVWTRLAGMQTVREWPGATYGPDRSVYVLGGFYLYFDQEAGKVYTITLNSVEFYTP